MGDLILQFFLYFLRLSLLTLGPLALYGFTVHLCERLFARLAGGNTRAVFYATSIIGTPVHELGHALMCLLFGHRITRLQLWNPHPERTGYYGIVSHSYNRRNPWARLGNLFIGLGPIFSGLGLVVLILCLCFPEEWSAYLRISGDIPLSDTSVSHVLSAVLSLFLSLLRSFGTHPVLNTLGLLVILSVSLHISLSGADIKNSLSALPLYLGLLGTVSLGTFLLGWTEAVTRGLGLFNIRVLSLFTVVIAFCCVWLILGLIIRLFRAIFSR